MKRVTILIAMLTIFVSTIMAQQVSVNEAMSRAKTFLQTSSKHRAPSLSGTASPELSLAYTAQNTTKQKNCFYVFNRGTNDGFIIVGGDETAQEILGYSDNGTFDYATAPDNFKWWLSQYQQQITSAISYAEAHPEAVATAKKAKAARKAASSTKSDISMLLTTRWNQDSPFNNAIPSLGSNYDPLVTGCVATAMAQVMKFHGYPTKGRSSHSYTKTWSNEDIGTKTFSADFANTTYDWDNMTDTYSSSSTDVENSAVATLMYHCGVSVDMSYNTAASGGSGASISKIPYALYTYFGYDKGMSYKQRAYYSDDDWEDMVYTELSNHRPVIYGGQAESSGHCFICDGYNANDKNFHFNWGWGGTGDGWYAMTGKGALTPKGDGIGSGGEGSSYTGTQEMITGVQASGSNNETVNFAEDNSSTGIYLTESSGSATHRTSYEFDASKGNKTLYLNASCYNYCTSYTSFDFGVKATDESGSSVYWTCQTNQTLQRLQGSSNLNLQFNLSKFTSDGTYTIVPVVRVANGTDNDWVDIKLVAGTTKPTITVSNAETVVQFTTKPYFNNDNNPYSADMKLYYSIYNPTSTAFSNLYAAIFAEGSTTGSVYPLSVDIARETTKSGCFDWSGLEFTVGKKYTMYFYKDAQYTDPMNIEYITFTYRDKLDYSYTLTSAGIGTLILPFNAEIPTGCKAYECNSMNGSALVLTEVTTLSRNTPYIIEGTAGTYSFLGPYAVDSEPVLFGNGYLKGTMHDNYYFQDGDYILQKQGEKVAFYKYTSESLTDSNTKWYATPYRAFLQPGFTSLSYASIPGFTNDETTGINAVTNTQKAAGIYSIGGVKLQQFQPGLNIIVDEQGNTHKVFIKK